MKTQRELKVKVIFSTTHFSFFVIFSVLHKSYQALENLQPHSFSWLHGNMFHVPQTQWVKLYLLLNTDFMAFRELQTLGNRRDRNTQHRKTFSILAGLHTRPKFSLIYSAQTHTKCLQVKVLLPQSVATCLQIPITACEPKELLKFLLTQPCKTLRVRGWGCIEVRCVLWSWIEIKCKFLEQHFPWLSAGETDYT